MKITLSIFSMIIFMQCGISPRFTHQLPKKESKYTEDAVQFDVYRQRIHNFDTADINREYELPGCPQYRHIFDNGLLINHITYEPNRTVTYNYDEAHNLASRWTETEDHSEKMEYRYDFENMKLEMIKNDTQLYMVKFFDSQNRIIREIDPDEYVREGITPSRKYFYEEGRLKLEEYYQNEELKIIKHYSYDRETNEETRLTYNSEGKLYGKRIQKFDGDDLAMQTEFEENGEQKQQYLYRTFRDRNGNVTKTYKINLSKKTADIYEYRIKYRE